MVVKKGKRIFQIFSNKGNFANFNLFKLYIVQPLLTYVLHLIVFNWLYVL